MEKIIEKLKNPKFLGMIAILIGLILVGTAVNVLLSDDEEVQEEPGAVTEEKISDAERQSLINQLPQTDEEDIEPEKAKKIMNLEVIMPDELAEMYLGDQYDRFVKEAEDFLVEYDFYMDTSRIVCTQLITVDYKKNITYLEFKMNNSARSIMTVEYRGNRDEFVFNFR